MAIVEQEVGSTFATEGVTHQLVAEVNRRVGFAPDSTATPQKGRAMMLGEGIRLEDNAFIRKLMRLRYGDNQEVD